MKTSKNTGYSTRVWWLIILGSLICLSSWFVLIFRLTYFTPVLILFLLTIYVLWNSPAFPKISIWLFLGAHLLGLFLEVGREEKLAFPITGSPEEVRAVRPVIGDGDGLWVVGLLSLIFWWLVIVGLTVTLRKVVKGTASPR